MLPADKNIEESVLACLMLGEKNYIPKLSDKDFTNPFCLEVFKKIKYLNETSQEIDIIQVQSQTIPLAELVNMTEKISTSTLIKSYFNQLKLLTTRREVIANAQATIKKASEGAYENPLQLKNESMGMLSNINVYSDNKKDYSLQNMVLEMLDDIEREHRGENGKEMRYGIPDLDKLTAGLHGSEMTIIAARPGIGKTAIALQMIINLAIQNIKTAMYSREMSHLSLCKRILSNISEIDGNKIRVAKTLTSEDFSNIGLAGAKMTSMPLIINDDTATIQEIYSMSKDLISKNLLDVIVIDYLGLLETSKKHETRRVALESISREIKKMALEFNIPVIVLCQLNRDNARTGSEPELHNLRETGSIEQDADNVMFLHIPKDVDDTQDVVEIKLILAKQRNGKTGYVDLLYDRSTFKFKNLLR